DQRRTPSPPAEPPSVGLSMEAERLIAKVAETYAKAPALRDAITINGGGRLTTLEAAFEGDDASFKLPGMRLTVLDGRFLVENESVADKYLVTPMNGDFLK